MTGSKPSPGDTRTDEEIKLLPSVTRRFDPAAHRERMRGVLAASLVGILGVTIYLGFLALSRQWATEEEIKDLLAVMLTPIVALAGSALGFYFGGRSRSG